MSKVPITFRAVSVVMSVLVGAIWMKDNGTYLSDAFASCTSCSDVRIGLPG